MKKLLYLALALVLALALCACGEGESTGNTTTGMPIGATADNTTEAAQQPTTETTEHTHDYQETMVNESSCSKAGLMFLKCKTCGDSDYKEIPAIGHTPVIDAAIEPTFTKIGLTEGQHCITCGEVLLAQEKIASFSNDDVNAIAIYSGKAGDDISWTYYDNHVLVFSGTGEMYEYYDTYYYNSGNVLIPWYGFSSFAKTVVVSEGITSICNFAFVGFSNTTSFSIPESIETIGCCAFEYCRYLTSIKIPSGMTNIGGYIFKGCSSLTNIDIPDSVTSIDEGAFYDCSSLTSITIPESVTSIGYNAFYQCTSLTSITIPDSVEYIGGCAFSGCSGLASVTIGNGVWWISDHIFANCSSLTSITIPDSVTHIESSAFSGCSGLTDIYFDGSYTEWNTIYENRNWIDSSVNYTVHCTDGDYTNYE